MQARTPPYGKPLRSLLSQGYRPANDVYLFIGHQAWRKAKSFQSSIPERLLVLPPWVDPPIYDWPVRQCNVLIFDTGYAEMDYVSDLAACLYRDEALKVNFISPDFVFYRYYKEF